MDPTSASGKLPAYQRIASTLRHDILTGKYAPGTLLPSTEEFAAMMSSSYFTVHTALKTLVKEGWVERLHGHGTYVAQPEQRFLHFGILHSLNIFSDEETTFMRCLNECLVRRIQELGKTSQIFIDSRPEPEQTVIFPPLAQAIFHRQVHCLIAPNPNSKSLPWLSELSLPFSCMTERPRIPGVTFDEEGMLRESIATLARQGCRTVGMITNVPPIDGSFGPFVRAVREAGLETLPEWHIQPPAFDHHLVEYGFRSFQRLWKQPRHPDGLIVYPDTAVRGVITAMLQAGVKVPGELKVVFHRNLRAQILCPFPATWAVADEDLAAEGLIASVQRQFAGEPPARLLVPFTLVENDSARWAW